ncbi:hypothetical protein HJD18_02430 [Thermoleophilia bacterium SCSIO 60948]|nr:hypothetical protein HJD18_02430 [Thermoleophilia bacterium SCSIO 60948]
MSIDETPRSKTRPLAIAALLVLALGLATVLSAGEGRAAPSEAASGDPFPASPRVSGPDFPGESGSQDRTAAAAPKRAGLSRKGLRRKLRSAMRSAGGGSGARVLDLNASKKPLLFSDSSSRARILASNTKLFTTAAYLDRFGADRELATTLVQRGQRTGTDDQILKGDLVIVGNGDPAFGTKSFAASRGLPLTSIADLARDAKRSGIKKVRGDVVADDSIFDRKRQSGDYLSPLSGLSFNSGYSSNGGYAGAPEREAAKRFVELLRKQGIRVTGKAKRIGRKGASRGERIGKVSSPDGATLARATNTPSNNFFAEMLLKRVGASSGKQGTTGRGASKAEKIARKLGAGVRIADGSGLSRGNQASPKQVVKLLTGVRRRSEFGDEFFDSLAIAGRTGTLSDRMNSGPAAGRCHAKTGTLSDVSALSGYCETGRDGLIAFSILMNSVSTTSARNAQDRMVQAIARFGR